MPRHLPPITGLRAFEATARLMSFTGAARELRVTQAAISLQIRSLETRLGTSLFERLKPGLALTEAGETLYPAAHAAFGLLAEAGRTSNGSAVKPSPPAA